jgi:hypothetical protein
MNTPPVFTSCLNIGLVLLSPDYRVIGMNAYARKVLGPAMSDFGKKVFSYHPRKSHPKIDALLQKAGACDSEVPVAMIIDVLNKVLVINVCRIEMKESSAAPLYAMTFMDVTEQTGAKVNPHTGMVELKKFPVCDKRAFLFLDVSSIYFIRSEGNYCKISTEKNSYYLHLTLKNILRRFVGQKFLRVHKSFVVNTEHIRKIQPAGRGQTQIIFDREEIPAVPVARRRLKDLKKALALI